MRRYRRLDASEASGRRRPSVSRHSCCLDGLTATKLLMRPLALCRLSAGSLSLVHCPPALRLSVSPRLPLFRRVIL